MELHQLLYQYIQENKLPQYRESEEYQTARAACRAAEDRLTDRLTDPQRRLFAAYQEEACRLDGLEQYRLLREALSLHRELLEL